ncbi:hypothetical protein QE152_g32497 [Popillia japonica]|uniref:Transposase n=1 Tax=Popillia japonica TaxID=7064 RepID=A0AAW1IZ33_POPJA
MASNLVGEPKTDHRGVKQFLNAEGNIPVQILVWQCFSKTTVVEWCRKFSNGRQSTPNWPKPQHLGTRRVTPMTLLCEKPLWRIGGFVLENGQIVWISLRKQSTLATYRRPSEHGTVHPVQGAGRVEVNHEDTEQVLERFEADPTLSIRKVVNDLGISQWKVWCTMRRNNGRGFCGAMNPNLTERELVISTISIHYWSPEHPHLRKSRNFQRRFSVNVWMGIIGETLIGYWSPEHPHLRETLIGPHFQRRFSVNVWMGIIGETLIGPHFLPDVLDGQTYEAFLRDHLFEMLDEVPLANRHHMVYQHDGCATRLFYGITYSKCWTKFL